MKGCINSAGVKYRWGYKKWTRTEWPHAQSYQVNLSPWMCNACRQRVAREVQAGAASISPPVTIPTLAAGGEGGAGAGLGESASPSEVDDFSTHAICLQLFERNKQLLRKVEDMSRLVG